MKVVYAREDIPQEKGPSIFLAGPTPRSNNPVPSWRPEALKEIESLGFEGIVFVPEDEDCTFKGSYNNQTNWEKEALHLSTIILFWVPRNIESMPAFTTNVEFGYWAAKDSSKIVYGRPDGAPKTKYLDWLLLSENQDSMIFNSLSMTATAAVAKSLSKTLKTMFNNGGSEKDL